MAAIFPAPFFSLMIVIQATNRPCAETQRGEYRAMLAKIYYKHFADGEIFSREIY